MRGEVRAGRRAGVARRRKRHARGKARDPRLLGARARAERTKNISYMAVTLEVSKLSGWLKAYVNCRVEGRGPCEAGRGCGPGGGRAWGGGGASGMHGEARLKAWRLGHARSALRTCCPCS